MRELESEISERGKFVGIFCYAKLSSPLPSFESPGLEQFGLEASRDSPSVSVSLSLSAASMDFLCIPAKSKGDDLE